MITIKDKCSCCGCSACASVCPKHCITMCEDDEGFLYPAADENTCIECGLCEVVCPVIHVQPDVEKEQRAYLVQHKNEQVLRESTSGGAFTAIARWVLDRGGVVCGAGFSTDFEVVHQWANCYEDLRMFRNSKYVQSRIGNTYKETKQFLMEGKCVLFSGTPCQLEGLFSFLRKPYENLVTVDVVCHACPSPLVYRKYLEAQKKKIGSEFTNILFRDKYYGYKYSTMSIIGCNDSIEYHEGIDTDIMMRAFFANMSVRPSCYQCAFKKRYRNTDFTIWDCFDVDKFSKELDNDKGVTRILAHSDLANIILKESSSQLKVLEINSNKAVEGVKEMFHSVSMNPKREAFFVDLNLLDAEVCFHKYFPVTLRHRLEKQARLWTARLGLYKYIKKIFKAINGNREIKR